MQWNAERQTVDELLDFLRIDHSKIEVHKVTVSFNINNIQIVELVYTDKKTKRLNRCIIGINGLEKANAITSGLYQR